jgi:hypothetical protein
MVQLYCEELDDLLLGYGAAVAGAAGAPPTQAAGMSVGSRSRLMSTSSVTSSAAAVDGVAGGQGAVELSIREDPTHGLYVEGLSWHRVGQLSDAAAVLQHAVSRRAVAATLRNAHSSRSHACTFLRMIPPGEGGGGASAQPPAPATARTGRGPLSPKAGGGGLWGGATAPTAVVPLTRTCAFLDLAGSERYSTAIAPLASAGGAGPGSAPGLPVGGVMVGAAGAALSQRTHEMKAINMSLTALGTVVRALAARSASTATAGGHIPFRNSVLTRMVAAHMGGDAVGWKPGDRPAPTCIVLTASPLAAQGNDTLATLQFGVCAASVKVVATSTLAALMRGGGSSGGATSHRWRAMIADLQAEIGTLRARLALCTCTAAAAAVPPLRPASSSDEGASPASDGAATRTPRGHHGAVAASGVATPAPPSGRSHGGAAHGGSGGRERAVASPRDAETTRALQRENERLRLELAASGSGGPGGAGPPAATGGALLAALRSQLAERDAALDAAQAERDAAQAEMLTLLREYRSAREEARQRKREHMEAMADAMEEVGLGRAHKQGPSSAADAPRRM